MISPIFWPVSFISKRAQPSGTSFVSWTSKIELEPGFSDKGGGFLIPSPHNKL